MPTLKIIQTPDGWVVTGFPKESEISVIGFWAKAYFYPGTSPTIYWNLPPANSGFALELKETVEQLCEFMIEFTNVVNEFRNLSYRICRNKKREGSSLNEAVSYMNERAINPWEPKPEKMGRLLRLDVDDPTFKWVVLSLPIFLRQLPALFLSVSGSG